MKWSKLSRWPKTTLAIGVAALSLSSVALGETRFDPSSGQGFVEARDVQRALKWNKKELEDNAQEVQFYYDSDLKFIIYCSNGSNEPDTNRPDAAGWPTSTLKRHNKVSASFAGESKGNKSGFSLTGMTVTNLPNEGMACHTGQGDQVGVTRAKVVSSSPGELTANGVHVYP